MHACIQQLGAALLLPGRGLEWLPPRRTGSSSSSARGHSRRRPTAAAAAHNSSRQPLHDPPSAYSELRQQLAQQHQQAAGALQQQHGGCDAAPGPAATSRRPQQQWPRPVDDVARAVSRRLKQADSAQQVLGMVTHHAAQFNAIHTALAFAQLARTLRFEGPAGKAAALSTGAFAQLQGLALRQAGELNPTQVSMVLTSLAWMAGPPAAAGDTAAPDVGSSSGAEAPHPQEQPQQDSSALLLQQLGQRLEQQLDAFEPEDTCHCLWALTKLGGLEVCVLAAATAHSLSAGWLQLLTAKPLSSLLWVHAHALQQQQQEQEQEQEHTQDQQQLVAAVVQELQQPGFLATWTPQELSVLLWSCAVLGIPLEQPPLQVQPAQLPLSVLEEVCRLCRERVVQFTPQGITMVCWSLSQLIAAGGSSSSGGGGSPQQQSRSWPQLPGHLQQQVLQLLAAFTGSAAAQLQFYKPQEVANLFGACARLAVPSRALSSAVGGYVTHHSHLLGGRDVTELLLGFVQQHVSPEPAAMRALLHRAGQLAQQAALTPYQLAGTAWCCVKLGGSYVSSSSGQRHPDARSSGSPAALLQQECGAAAASLLGVLEGKLSVEAAAAAGHVAPQAVWERVFPGSSQHPKQAVILAWTLAATQPVSQNSSSGGALRTAVLQQLHAISGSCNDDTAVQVLCVLVRLTAAGGAPAHHEQQLVAAACEASVRAVLSGLHSLPPQDAVTAAWAAVKLQTQLSSSSSGAGDGSPTALLVAVVGRLQQQQQLAGLPVHSLVALLWCCRAARWLPPPAVVAGLAAAAYNRVLQLGSEELVAVVLALAHFQQQQQQLPPHQQAQLQQLLSRVAARVGRQLQVLLEQECQSDSAAGLQPGQLVTVAVACSHLPQLQAVPGLLVEVWQLRLQAGAVSTQQALQMVAALADCQQQLKQQQVVPLLLQHALGLVAQQLSTTAQQQVPTASAGLAAAQALCLCAKLRYQPQPRVLALLCRQLCASLPLLPDKQLVHSLHALAHLGAPAQQPAAAVLQALLHRQQQQQHASGKRWAGLPHHLAVQCLWSALLLGVHTPQLMAGSSTRRFLVMLAHQVSGMPTQQLLRAPHLLQLALQARQLLKQGAHQRMHRALRVLRVALPAEGLLTQQLAGMTQLLLPEGLVGSSRRPALARLLSAAPQQLAALVAQELQQEQPHPHAMPACWQQLLPLWQHQQLQQACLQRLAVRVAAAQARAKQPAAAAKLRHLPSGDVALLLLPAQRPGQRQRQPKRVAVLLESGSDVAANTGWQLGPSLARQAALQAQGYSVHTLPLACWVPGWLAQHQQQQQPQRQAGASRRGKLLVARHNQLRRLVAALRPPSTAAGSCRHRRRAAGGVVQAPRRGSSSTV